MTPNRAIGLIVALVVLFGSQNIGRNPSGYVFADEPPPLPGQEQPEVLTRGPVNEAFAEPVPLQVQAGLMVPKPPPANIVEVPPADRPQGDHFVWIPGYWGWDADRNDYLWVSACWRAGPPNMSWVPGYWAQVADVQPVRRGGVDVQVGGLGVRVGGHAAPVATASWEWVSGFWASADAQEVEYLPAPPAPVDLEPPGPPPAADTMWVPGCWSWQNDQYVRRNGYWLKQQPNWVWEPSHYRWTPRGYVFQAGHWDYALDRRGVLFAPVYFTPALYGQAGYSYSPTIAVDVGALSINLFTYPRYSHYYFGDYYDDAYLNAGIYPQFQSDSRHTYYDPIYTYNRWHYGQADGQWAAQQQQGYDQRRANKDLRPARTYQEMTTRVAKMPEAQRQNYELAKPIQTIAAGKASPLKFEKMNADAQQKVATQAGDVHKFRNERAKWEATGATNPNAVKPPAETTAIPSAGPKGPVTPAVEPKGPITPVIEPKGSVTPVVEPKGSVTPAIEPKGPVTPVVEPKGVVTPAAEHTPAIVPPRDVNLTKSERVKMPVPPPVVGKPGKSGDVENGPPPPPVEEKQHQAEPAIAPKAEPANVPKADVKDAPKGK